MIYSLSAVPGVLRASEEARWVFLARGLEKCITGLEDNVEPRWEPKLPWIVNEPAPSARGRPARLSRFFSTLSA